MSTPLLQIHLFLKQEIYFLILRVRASDMINASPKIWLKRLASSDTRLHQDSTENGFHRKRIRTCDYNICLCFVIILIIECIILTKIEKIIVMVKIMYVPTNTTPPHLNYNWCFQRKTKYIYIIFSCELLSRTVINQCWSIKMYKVVFSSGSTYFLRPIKNQRIGYDIF